MRRALIVVAVVAVALLVAGCVGKSRHAAVSNYLTKLNAIQAKFAPPLLAVSNANREFASPHSNPVTVRHELLNAAKRIDAVRVQLVALDAPADAQPLKALLMQLATREAALAREVAGLATFLPAFQARLLPLGAAGDVLKRTLSGKTSVAAKAAALDTYTATLGGVLAQLRKLRPPPVGAALYASQITTIQAVRSSTAALAKALREKRSKDIPTLLHRFNLAAVSNQSLAAQRAQIQAVRTYNGEIAGLDRLAARITREQARLQRTLG